MDSKAVDLARTRYLLLLEEEKIFIHIVLLRKVVNLSWIGLLVHF